MGNPLSSIRRNWGLWLATIATLGLVLAPWWRNRTLLRDFFDYGLMMVSSGRLADGQRPFVDFITPLQTFSYLLNYWSDRAFGQDYLALTWGNGVLIAVALPVLVVMLRRWFSAPVALLLAAVLVVGSLSQHTIIWYNAVGVLLLAPIAWCGALAPVLKREQAAFNVMVAVALVLSGMNKLNFHGIAIAVALAWTVRAGLVGQAAWGRVAITAVAWVVFGLVVPLGVELAWTGATWEQWRYSVIDTAFRDRGNSVFAIFSPELYFETVNDFYHAALKPLGAILGGWLLLVAILAWKGRGLWDRLALAGAVALALFGTQALLLTNYEIGYVSFSAGMVLILGIWLGYDLPRKGWKVQVGLVVPMLVLGGVFWHSAWLGQRALFGHSAEPRAAYREVTTPGDDFKYLAGTRIPPDMAGDLESLAEVIAPSGKDGEYPYFFGSGVEWLERVWPGRSLQGLPLLMAALGYGEPELKILKHALSYPSTFDGMVGMSAWETLPGDMNTFISGRSFKQRFGTLVMWEFSRAEAMHGLPPNDDAVEVINSFGGNLDGRLVVVEAGVHAMITPDSRSVLGLTEGTGGFLFLEPSHSVEADLSLSRVEGTPVDEALAATFIVQVVDTETHEILGEPWRETITLPAGETHLIAKCKANTFGRPARFSVALDEASAGKLAAGWLLPRVQNTASKTQYAPRLRTPSPEETAGVDRAWREAIFPPEWVDDIELVVRNGRLTDRGVSIDRGGELWFRGKRRIAEWWGGFVAEETNADWNLPVPRLVWYNGGRIEIIFQQGIPAGSNPTQFHAWSPELDGWFGILVDRGDWKPGVLFKVDRMTGREP